MFGFKSKQPAETEPGKDRLLNQLKLGLKRTHALLLTDVADLLQGARPVDQGFIDTLEDHLLLADFGVPVTQSIVNALPVRIKDKTDQAATVYQALRELLHEILVPVEKPLNVPAAGPRPFVILMAGVNGVGKTTSIGKIANHFIRQDQSVMLAAGDTFRAAAVEQLQNWGTKNNVTVIAQHSGADSAAVIYDALQSARARNIDILIADTAGRLHTQGNLMDELKKIRRVITKFDPALEPECLLVLDAGTGQNALMQTRQFNEAIGITGIMLTKLDGTAKGGIIFALARETGIPIRFIGVGEQLDDLQVFNSNDFITALLSSTE
jgi:fused signal recognition particle receptor